MKEKVYQVVSEAGTQYFNREDLLAKFELIGFNYSPSHREELQGEPKLKGLLGPMYGGDNGVTCIIRYESQAVYDFLSC